MGLPPFLPARRNNFSLRKQVTFNLLREEETCKTDNSTPLYTMSAILHIQILLHAAQPEPAELFLAAQPEPAEPFLAAQLELFLAAQPEPFLTAQAEPVEPFLVAKLEPFLAAQPEPFLAVVSRTRNPRPLRASQSNPKPPPCATQSRTRNLPCAVPIQNVPDSSRSELVVLAAACRYRECLE